MKRFIAFSLVIALTACFSPPKPPEPSGFRVPVNNTRTEQPTNRISNIGSSPGSIVVIETPMSTKSK